MSHYIEQEQQEQERRQREHSKEIRENMKNKCDCNKNFGNKDLQGSHDIDCESRKQQDKWNLGGVEAQEQVIKDMITKVLDNHEINQSEFLIYMRDSILDYIGELK